MHPKHYIMTVFQKTLKSTIAIQGLGLHSGLNVNVVIHPAQENFGYKFQRVDLENKPVIEALAENVIDTSRGTTIANGDATVSTIEHLLAALRACEVDNALIEIDGPEVPILNGSSEPFIKQIDNAGVVDQNIMRDYLELTEKMVFKNGNGIEIIAYPDDKFSVDVMVDYNSKVLGSQYAYMEDIKDFKNEIAPCKTFVFFHELEVLLKNNLIKGGDLENAIVIMEKPVPQEELDRMADLFNKPRVEMRPEGILNNVELLFENEPARHKLLDVVGDLALVGKHLKAKIIAKKPGHQANTQFAKELRKIIIKENLKPKPPKYDPNQVPLMDLNEIKRRLPHRYPFLLVDKILEISDTIVTGLKNVTFNEPFFIGHFPDEPVMPGVLLIEAMAQTGGILVLGTVPDPENYTTYFLKIDKVKFKKKVVPGDTLLFKLELIEPIRRGIAHMFGRAFVGDALVSEAELMAQIVKVKNNN